MQDAVAEILLERRALVPRRSRSLVVSLVLHALFAMALLIGARRPPALPQTTNVLNIRLAPAPQPVAPPVTKPALPQVEPPNPEKPKVDTPPKKPVEKAL